ncbi:hypothetical protein HanHA300_Chr11g0395441 [Helianthus annuus]|nr:hypothetical protein HanHA300_Chr11g0395441 [Helianthus annuus]KAJ0516867.1 hypothetical protein HanHA89_Chr11g0418651 [Helianthus annuus]KAJ0684872.1 hypothetical protein HanLR1_Chr11g0396081 [Helianthus annuus]
MQRHRNPANGYRSNPIGTGTGFGGGGLAAGGAGYRSYNRGGFGRGQPPPPRRIDVFMEAGKLAAEYLVSKGLIPPNSGNGKWQIGNLKNQSGGGDSVSDRRRFPDDYRGRRALGSFKNAAVEVNREVNRSNSLSEKVKGLSDKQGDGDSVSGVSEEQRVGKDGGIEDQKSVSGDLESKSYDAGNVDTGNMNQQDQSPDENASVKTPVSEERIDGLKDVNVSADDVAMDDGTPEPEKPVVEEDPPEEDNNKTSNNNSSDLLTLIRFNKIPTRTRSSVTLKGSKSDPVLISGDENRNKQDDENQVSNHEPEMKIEQVPSEDDHKYEFGQGLHTRSLSFPQRSSVSDQELSDGQHGYTRSSSALLGVGEKRPMQDDASTEASKKPREWAPANPQADEFFHISSSRDQASSQEVAGFSSLVQAKQEPVSVDFDLTMNNSCHMTDRHGKGVEVIDLDCDSMQEDDDNDNDNDNNNSERREEAIFTDLESFPDSMQRVSDIPQDGYGLMISELLDADIPNSSVSTGVNSMHNEMSLPNEEGMLGDDESIYMSLGEIPISMPKL